MKQRILKSAVFSLFLATLFLVSCEQDTFEQFFSADTEDFVDQSLFEIEERGNMGRFGCYDLVFPVTINFPDESSAEVEDYEGLRTAIGEWKEANPDAEARPSLAFPIEVMSEDGELITVEDQAGLRELKRECRRGFFNGRGHRGHGGRCGKCFTIVYPVSVAFPDGTTTEFEDRRDMKTAIRAWKAANPDAEERPELVFPIQVELEEDESIVEVADKEALAALREECRGDN